MTRHLPAALRVLALAALLAALTWTLRTAAQPADRVEAIARVTVAEEGFVITDGHAAISHLLVRRAARLGLTPRRMAHAYSSRHFDAARIDSRRWIADLRLDAHRPRGWPRGTSWARHRPQWIAVVEHVRAVLRGEVADPCGEGLPDHWAARSIDRSALGWVRVDCGNAANIFWRIPRRGSDGA